MANCSFCGRPMQPGQGFTIFKRDGTGMHYDSRKCRRAAEMGRNASKLKWTAKYAKA